jgi:hypothetical protein
MIAAGRMDSMTYIAIGMVVVAVVLEAIDQVDDAWLMGFDADLQRF